MMLFLYRISLFLWVCTVFLIFLQESFALTYIPASEISLTGANEHVFLDTEQTLVDEGVIATAPKLHTDTLTFSGAFYLTGAGWIDFSTGSFGVSLDCGGQPLTNITNPCVLSGTAYGELIGEVVFDRKVQFDPVIGTLSGTISTYIGEYTFSGVFLPLIPAVFAEDEIFADRHASLSISGGHMRYGGNSWNIVLQSAIPGVNISPPLAGLSDIDLTHAGVYHVSILDPQGSQTKFDYSVQHNIPSMVLDGETVGSEHEGFCMINPSFCPDGQILSPSQLSTDPGSRIANGKEAYEFTLKLRDRYGNQVKDGFFSIKYEDHLRPIQVEISEYINKLSEGSCLLERCSITVSGDINNNMAGDIFLTDAAVLGGAHYSIASLAPTSLIDTLQLQSIQYKRKSTDTPIDFSLPSQKNPLIFTPWYTTALTSTPIIIGQETGFETHTQNMGIPYIPNNLQEIYHLQIGNSQKAAYKNFSSNGTIHCTKYVNAIGVGLCNWIFDPDTSVIVTDATAFSGVYTSLLPGTPPPEMLSYRSYIRYESGSSVFLYPSSLGNIDTSVSPKEYIKILGQSSSSLQIGSNAEFWNTLRKNLSLARRSRGTSAGTYDDVPYSIIDGDRVVRDSDFDQKRVLVSYGGNITIEQGITHRDRPLAIIALPDESGTGGNISIESGVTDIHAMLIADRSVMSTGSYQLYINGSIISHNTLGGTECPYYLPASCDRSRYDLLTQRAEYLTLPDTSGQRASNPRTLGYPTIPLIIEYDGRILSDPPPIVEKFIE